MTHPKIEAAHVGGPSPTAGAASTERLLTTEDVAVVLKVSVRTVERMLHDGEITPVRLRGLVRFRLEDVIAALRKEDRKWGRAARLAPGGNPKAGPLRGKSEIRNPKAISSERTQGA
jgi:excisionase family DNA binding protein